MTAARLEILLDVDEFQAGLSLLVDAVERSPRIRDALVSLAHGGVELATVHVDDSAAAGAGQLRARLEFAEPFRELVAAARAGDLHA